MPGTTAPSFDDFYAGTAARIVRHAYALTGDQAEAQDVAQEAFARAWQRWSTVRGCDSPEAWVRRVATNLAVSRWRRAKAARQAVRDLSADCYAPEVSSDTVALVAGLRTLPERQRVVLVLHYLADLPIDQIAAELCCPSGSVKGWLSRGRTALAAAVRAEDSESPDASRPTATGRSARPLSGRSAGQLCVPSSGPRRRPGMADDQLRELFDQIARAAVRVPDPGQVIARGMRRRRRARLQVSASAMAAMAAVGVCTQPLASQLAGAGAPHRYQAIGHGGRTVPGPAHRAATAAAALPPAGAGVLILGLTRRNTFVIARSGNTRSAVRLAGLRALSTGQSALATNPSGGWVVTYAADPNGAYGSQSARLAVVTTAGQIRTFGPILRNVTSVAVSPDGGQVGVGLLGPLGDPAAIELVPLPGRNGRLRSWQIPHGAGNYVAGLSWAPDGTHLSYQAGQQAGSAIAGGPITLDTTASGTLAPGRSSWPAGGQSGAACVPDATAWLSTPGRMLALEQCDGTEVLREASSASGAAVGPAIRVWRRTGCGSPALDPAPDGSHVLIRYCSVYLESNGRLEPLPGDFAAAALAGPGGQASG